MFRPPSTSQLFELCCAPLNEKGTDVFDPKPGCCAWLEATPGCRVINWVKLRVFRASCSTCVPYTVLPTLAVSISTSATFVSTESKVCLHPQALPRADGDVIADFLSEPRVLKLKSICSGGHVDEPIIAFVVRRGLARSTRFGSNQAAL